MPESNGIYTRVHDWTDDAANSINIEASRFDAEMDGMVSSINNRIHKAGHIAFTGDQSMGSNKLESLADGTVAADAANLKLLQNAHGTYATAGGTGDAITLALSPAMTAYAAGQQFTFVAAANNTGATTLNVDTVGAKAVQLGGAALTGGEINTNDIVTVVYDGTVFEMIATTRITLGHLASTAYASEAEADAGTENTKIMTPLRVTQAGTGIKSVSVAAASMWPTTTNGAADPATVEVSAGHDAFVVDFADGASELHAQFGLTLPKAWDAGTITWKARYLTNGTSTNGISLKLKAVALTDSDPYDTAFGTAVEITDNPSGTANDINETAESAAVTIAGTPAKGEYIKFDVSRDPTDADDTNADTVRLVEVQIFYTTDALTDD